MEQPKCLHFGRDAICEAERGAHGQEAWPVHEVMGSHEEFSSMFVFGRGTQRAGKEPPTFDFQ